MDKLKILELFAGSRSVGSVAEKYGHTVFSVDYKPFKKIDLCVDIENITPADIPFIPDVVWASPDCTTYSIAAISKHRNGTLPKSEYAKKCDSVNKNFILLILVYLSVNPDLVFFIENPRGMFRKMPFLKPLFRVKNFNHHLVWFCQYGDDRAKPTDIFTNSKNFIPRPICKNGNKKCHHQRAPRGSKTGTQGRKNSFERSKIPAELCESIVLSVS